MEKPENEIEMQDPDSHVVRAGRQDENGICASGDQSCWSDEISTPTSFAQRAHDWKRQWDESEVQRRRDLENSALKQHWRQKDRERKADEYQTYNEQRREQYAAMIAETEERPVREYRKAPPEQVANANEKSRLRMQQFRARMSPEEQAAVRERNRLQKRKARAIAKQRKGVLEDGAMSGNST
jgi:hypothetical protein